MEINNSIIEKHNLKLVAGRMPINHNEIAISDYAFDCFKKWGYSHINLMGDVEESKNIDASNITSGQDFIAKEPNILIEGTTLNGIFKIVGIIKTGYNYSRYDTLDKTINKDDALDYYVLQDQFTSEHGSSFAGMLFGCDNFINSYLEYSGVGGEIPGKASFECIEINGESSGIHMGSNYTHYFTADDYSDIVYLSNSQTTLLDNEIMLGINIIIKSLKNIYYNNSNIIEKLNNLVIDKMNVEEIKTIIKPLLENIKIQMKCGGILNPYLNKTLTIKGFFFENEDVDDQFVCVSQSLRTEIKNIPVDKYSMVISGEKLSKRDLEKVVNFSMQTNNGVKYSLVNYVVSVETMVGSLIKSIAQVLLYIGIGIFIFAIVLFMTYISASVTYKKSEIGILRAVGARSSDVFGIFFNEALTIAFIVFCLAAIGSSISVAITNATLRSSYGLPITLLSYGIREICFIFFGCIITSLLASFIPVIKIARKKPVDAIKNI